MRFFEVTGRLGWELVFNIHGFEIIEEFGFDGKEFSPIEEGEPKDTILVLARKTSG